MKQSKQPFNARRRYVNFEDLPLPSETASYSNFNWDSVNWNQGFDSLTHMLEGIFSPSTKWTSQMNAELYNQEKRTNTILWVIIGLMVALGVVLLVRKH